MLKSSLVRMAALLGVAGAVFGQTAAAPAVPAAPTLSFEVASVKAAGPLDPMAIVSGKAHIGMSVDKARVDIGGSSLLALICQAYKVKPYDVTGGPDWLTAGFNADRFDILAKMPEGATKDQVPEMLQSLLADRFKLTLHREKRETPVYALVVGKGGPKMKEAPPDPAEPAAAAAPAGDGASAPAAGSDTGAKTAPAKGEMSFGSGDNKVTMKQSSGGVLINSKETGPMRMMPGDNGAWRLEGEKMTMAMLTAMLSQYLDRPVVDLTELKGKYQVALDLSMDTLMAVARKAGMNMGMMGGAAPGGAGSGKAPAEAASDPGGSSLFASVQQLGLKLEPRKLPYDFLVIDHIEKTPTEN